MRKIRVGRPLRSYQSSRPRRTTFVGSTARAVIWSFLATASGKLITLVGMAILARIVAPREFHNPSGAPLLRLLAWSFPIKYLGNTHEALLRKDLRFRALLLRLDKLESIE